jgi:hypothetical protein
MLSKRPDLREAMIARRWRVGVMAHTEMTTDIPEHRNRKKPPPSPNMSPAQRERYEKMTDKEYWDNRARGLGGNPTTCAEENLLGYPGTRYYGENILVHEFAHAVMGGGIRAADPKLYEEIQAAYKNAMAKGLWKGHYGATNAGEYWAEAAQTWFWSNYEFTDGEKRIQSPEDLKSYDPTIYELLGRVFPDHRIPMDIYYGKNIPPRARSAAPPAPATPADQIRAVLDRQAADWNRGDVRAFMQGYDDSEETTYIGKTVVKGYQRVLQRYLQAYPSPESMGTLSFSDIEIRPLGREHASAVGRFHLRRAGTAGGDATGIFSLILRRTPAGWKIILDHTS